MSDKNGADSTCALFVVMTKGYAGSFGAALKCREEKCPEGFRKDIWIRLKKWADRTLEKYEGCEECESLHSALWNIGKDGYGFKINVRDIPLEQEAVEISEALGLNVFDLGSADFEVRVSSAYMPDGFVCIGFAEKGRDKLLINGEEISYLNRPPK